MVDTRLNVSKWVGRGVPPLFCWVEWVVESMGECGDGCIQDNDCAWNVTGCC